MGYSAPIAALTAFAEESNVKDFYDSGMNHFLRYYHSSQSRHPPKKRNIPITETFVVNRSDAQLSNKFYRNSQPFLKKLTLPP
jgi:osomolarity two-component system sensor histidine kinase SLN1